MLEPTFLTSPRLRNLIYPNLRRGARKKCSTYCQVRLPALFLARLVSPGIRALSLRTPVRNAGGQMPNKALLMPAIFDL
jgi:hypothetical protein